MYHVFNTSEISTEFRPQSSLYTAIVSSPKFSLLTPGTTMLPHFNMLSIAEGAALPPCIHNMPKKPTLVKNNIPGKARMRLIDADLTPQDNGLVLIVSI